ncbi:MAG: MmcQ/YjbR family DNA-binding protein [Bryobacteraceae bacterium]|jgi:predicted DNA-binding protein (MmcQ/YjbR family)
MIERLRKICLALPAAVETTNFGHPFFRFNKKPFCVFHGEKDAPAIAFKVLKSEAGIFLEDPRFFKTPYMHHSGWISLHAKGKLDWKEIKELVQASYDLTVCARPARKNASSI